MLKFPADRRPLVIDTAKNFPADFTAKGGTTRRLSFGTLHGNAKIVKLIRHFRGNPAIGEFIGFRPVK